MNAGIIFFWILVAIIIWISFGFIAFLIEAKIENYSEFDEEARTEFRAALAFGLVSLIIILAMLGYQAYLNGMNNLLKKMNKKEKE